MTVRETVAEIFGGAGGGAYNADAERDRHERAQARNSATSEEIEWDDLVGHREGILRDSAGRLWRFSLAYQRGGHGPATFTVGPSGHVSWLDPATPFATVAEEEAAERALELERERADKARIVELDALPLADVTLAAVEGRTLPTLAAAAATIEADRGTVSVEDGRLRVRLREGGSAPARPFLIDAARLLFLAERDVVAALEAGRPIPDVPVTPAGAIIVTDPGGGARGALARGTQRADRSSRGKPVVGALPRTG